MQHFAPDCLAASGSPPGTLDAGTGPGGPGCSGRFADPEYSGAALSAAAAGGRSAVLHRHRLTVLDLATLSTLHAVSGHWNRPFRF